MLGFVNIKIYDALHAIVKPHTQPSEEHVSFSLNYLSKSEISDTEKMACILVCFWKRKSIVKFIIIIPLPGIVLVSCYKSQNIVESVHFIKHGCFIYNEG